MQAFKFEKLFPQQFLQGVGNVQSWLIFGISVALVSLPVFVQAPMVRSWPWFSLVATAGWLLLSRWLLTRPSTYLWGDLLWGFALSWFAGSIYWGWFRAEPFLHLPIEALGLPLVGWAWQGTWGKGWAWKGTWGKVGMGFYLGALLGTVITDLYFYAVDLIPYWRSLIQADSIQALTILQQALIRVQSLPGQGWAMFLVLVLCLAATVPLMAPDSRAGHPHKLHWWVFSGAVSGTLLVDSLFLLVANRF